MNEFPSRIISVRTKHFLAVLMEQHLSPRFLNECLEEAKRRETEEAPAYIPSVESVLHTLAEKL